MRKWEGKADLYFLYKKFQGICGNKKRNKVYKSINMKIQIHRKTIFLSSTIHGTVL